MALTSVFVILRFHSFLNIFNGIWIKRTWRMVQKRQELVGSSHHASNVESHQDIQIKLPSTFQCPMFAAPFQSPRGWVCVVGGDVALEDVIYSLSPSLRDSIL
ncbi:hypothetical protein ILYODFUR_003536 [Ilyodon furcidens]|uniref:Uncharacterized protein n=1 Tax=Ilyodon furcidens TaxID=33524 RepID=A0ABV0T7Q2_9TELE